MPDVTTKLKELLWTVASLVLTRVSRTECCVLYVLGNSHFAPKSLSLTEAAAKRSNSKFRSLDNDESTAPNIIVRSTRLHAAAFSSPVRMHREHREKIAEVKRAK